MVNEVGSVSANISVCLLLSAIVSYNNSDMILFSFRYFKFIKVQLAEFGDL